MLRHVLIAVLALSGAAAACVGADEPSVDEAGPFCQIVGDIERVYDRNPEDVELPQIERDRIRALVGELEPLVPDNLTEDYLLRYWPSTAPLPSWVDTGGVRTARAYDTWRAHVTETC